MCLATTEIKYYICQIKYYCCPVVFCNACAEMFSINMMLGQCDHPDYDPTMTNLSSILLVDTQIASCFPAVQSFT